MNVRAAILVAPLAVLAGCATAPRTTYHYDGTGDYYTGVTPGADVVVSAAPGWGYGYPGWGYAYGGWAGYGGYGSPWWHGGYAYGGWPWWNGYPIHVLPPRQDPPRARLQRNGQPPPPQRSADVGPGDARRAGTLPSSAYAPLRAPVAPRAVESIRPIPRIESQRAPTRMPSIAPARVAPPPPPPPRAAPSFERAAPPTRSASKRE